MSLNNSAASVFRVVGLMEAKGGTSLGNQDDQVFVTITTMQARLLASRNARGATNVSVVNVQVDDEKQMAPAVASIGELLRDRKRHRDRVRCLPAQVADGKAVKARCAHGQ